MTRSASREGSGLGVVDHDVHGIVGVRLVGPSPADAAMVARQIGPAGPALPRDPDIVIRFENDLRPGRLRWVDLGRTGYDEQAFFVVPSGRRPSRARLSLAGLDGPLEIVCQRRGGRVPFLVALVALAALRHGCAPLHASAFRYEGAGVLVTGWAKGGKTEALLAFAARGAEYIGDEWILVAPREGRLYGLPEHIRLQDWHLDRLPAAARLVPASRRRLFAAIRGLERLHRRLPRRAAALAPARLLDSALAVLLRQVNVQLDPMAIFGRGPSRFSCPLDALFLMVSADGGDVAVTPADPRTVALQAAASLRCELLPLRAAALAHAFAFPRHDTGWLDRAETLAADRIAAAFDHRDAYLVEHPYPVDLAELFEAMARHTPGRASAGNPDPVTGRAAARGPLHAEPAVR